MHFPKYIDDSAVSSYRMTLTISYAGKPWKKGSSWRSSNVKVILEDGTAETSMYFGKWYYLGLVLPITVIVQLKVTLEDRQLQPCCAYGDRQGLAGDPLMLFLTERRRL